MQHKESEGLFKTPVITFSLPANTLCRYKILAKALAEKHPFVEHHGSSRSTGTLAESDVITFL